MAFDFPRAAKKLFFPTVHIHDGKVHDKADFDHALYCQAVRRRRLDYEMGGVERSRPAYSWTWISRSAPRQERSLLPARITREIEERGYSRLGAAAGIVFRGFRR